MSTILLLCGTLINANYKCLIKLSLYDFVMLYTNVIRVVVN